ncbi:MAG: hypothetical protein JWP84_2139 [Tardiphaga sp.]|nr:hypothetical protein [Tardiphaga sp.]
MYRSLNTYPGLPDEMIEGNPDQKTDAELEDAAISIRLFPVSSATSMAA